MKSCKILQFSSWFVHLFAIKKTFSFNESKNPMFPYLRTFVRSTNVQNPMIQIKFATFHTEMSPKANKMLESGIALFWHINGKTLRVVSFTPNRHCCSVAWRVVKASVTEKITIRWLHTYVQHRRIICVHLSERRRVFALATTNKSIIKVTVDREIGIFWLKLEATRVLCCAVLCCISVVRVCECVRRKRKIYQSAICVSTKGIKSKNWTNNKQENKIPARCDRDSTIVCEREQQSISHKTNYTRFPIVGTC